MSGLACELVTAAIALPCVWKHFSSTAHLLRRVATPPQALLGTWSFSSPRHQRKNGKKLSYLLNYFSCKYLTERTEENESWFDSQFHHGRKGMAALRTASVVRKQTADREGVSQVRKLVSPTPSLLPPSRFHLLKSQQPSKIGPARYQVFKHMTRWGHFSFKPHNTTIQLLT